MLLGASLSLQWLVISDGAVWYTFIWYCYEYNLSQGWWWRVWESKTFQCPIVFWWPRHHTTNWYCFYFYLPFRHLLCQYLSVFLHAFASWPWLRGYFRSFVVLSFIELGRFSFCMTCKSVSYLFLPSLSPVLSHSRTSSCDGTSSIFELPGKIMKSEDSNDRKIILIISLEFYWLTFWKDLMRE